MVSAHATRGRGRPVCRTSAATPTSRSETDDERAAKKSNPKKAAATTPPKGIAANPRGRVVNSSSVPSAGSSPTLKTTGKITKPAKSATPMSATVMRSDGRTTSVSSSR